MNSFSTSPNPLHSPHAMAPIPFQGQGNDFIQRSIQTDADRPVKVPGYFIRYVLQGQEQVSVNGQRFVIPAEHFLLLNPQQEVNVRSRGKTPSLGISVFLSLSDLRRSFRLQSWEEMPSEDAWVGDRLFVIEQVYSGERSELGKAISTLISRYESGSCREGGQILESRMRLSGEVLRHQMNIHRQINHLTSAKISTRRELYRRLCHARTFIHENLDSPLELDTLSQVACLSKFHFIRLFKEAFGQTPRQYLISKRLSAASELLIHSTKTFHEICHEVGLKDSSSFGRLFKRSFGATPHLYRQLHAAG